MDRRILIKHEVITTITRIERIEYNEDSPTTNDGTFLKCARFVKKHCWPIIRLIVTFLGVVGKLIVEEVFT